MGRRLASLLSLAMLAACAHATSSGFVPSTNPNSVASLASTSGTFEVKIVIPESTPGFVSPSTKSIGIEVLDTTGKTVVVKKVVNVGKGATGCSGTTTVSCTIVFSVPAGKYLFDATTFDGALGRGHALSALLNLPETVFKGTTRFLNLALGGLAKSISVTGRESTGLTGTAATGFSIYGNAVQSFTAVALDADGEILVGPKAPVVTVVSGPGSATTATPSPTSITITSKYNASDPTVPLSTSLKLQALPVAGSGGTTVALTVPVKLYQPWVYVADYSAGKVVAFDEQGNKKTIASGKFTVPDAGYVLYSPSNNSIYAVKYGGYASSGSAPFAFTPTGTAKTLSGAWTGVAYAGQMTLDTKTNTIYMPNYEGGTNGVTAYDLQGNSVTLSPSGFSSMQDGGWLMTYDAVHDQIYGINWSSGVAGAFDASGTPVSSGPFNGIDAPYGMAYDPKDDRVYVGNKTGATVYDHSGNTVTVNGTWANLPGSATFAYDPYNDKLYTAAYESYTTTVRVYDPEGNAQTLGQGAFGGLSAPMGVLVVP